MGRQQSELARRRREAWVRVGSMSCALGSMGLSTRHATEHLRARLPSRGCSLLIDHAHTGAQPQRRSAELASRSATRARVPLSAKGSRCATWERLETLGRRLVFEPLGMTRSSFVWEDRFHDNRAYPHDAFGTPALGNKPAEANAAWSLQTCAVDCGGFLIAVLDDDCPCQARNSVDLLRALSLVVSQLVEGQESARLRFRKAWAKLGPCKGVYQTDERGSWMRNGGLGRHGNVDCQARPGVRANRLACRQGAEREDLHRP